MSTSVPVINMMLFMFKISSKSVTMMGWDVEWTMKMVLLGKISQTRH